MLEILTIILPIFLVIAIGYVSVRTGLIEQSIISGLGRFVLVIALPAMIIMALANTDLESIFQPAFFLVYGGGMLLCYLLMFLFARRVMGDDLALAGIKSFGASFPNSVFVGYALLLRAFDDPPVAALAMVLMVENILMMPLLLSVLEIGSKGRSGGWGDTAATLLRTLATNPIIIAIVIGTTLAVLDVSLPSIVSGSLGMLGNASAGVALFFIGGTLAGVTVRGNSSDIAQITAFKLIVHPLIVAGLVWLLPPFDANLQRTAILISAAPMVSIFPVISSKYGYGKLSSSGLMVAMVFSFFTISLVLALL